MKVLYSCDENYLMQVAVSICSLCENNKEFQNIDIYFVGDGISECGKRKLEEVVEKYKATIIFFDCDMVLEKQDIKLTGRHPRTIFTKLFLGFLKDVDRIIYLDCDTVIKGSLRELWEMYMGVNIVMGVEMPYSDRVKGSIGVVQKGPYICDGVVLIDVEKWMEYGIDKKCSEHIIYYNGDPPMMSEGTLNSVCIGKIGVISPIYNLMGSMIVFSSEKIKAFFDVKNYYSEKELEGARRDPVIVHFINELYGRPWYENCDHPYKDSFLEYLAKTPWDRQPLGKGKKRWKNVVVRIAVRWMPTWMIRIFGKKG